jgi:Flp pilus assembly protein TadG
MAARRSANSGKAHRQIATDESGVSAIEFALIAPILIVMFMALCDLCSAVMTKLHVDRASEGTGDVVATYSEMQSQDMINMFTAASQFMQPYSATPLNIRITDIYSAQDNTNKVYWSCALNNYTSNSLWTLPPYDANQTVTLSRTNAPFAALATVGVGSAAFNSSVIMVEINYAFSSPTNRIITATTLMSSTAYMQPRQGLYVGFPWAGGSTQPAAPSSTTTSSSTPLTIPGFTVKANCNYRK